MTQHTSTATATKLAKKIMANMHWSGSPGFELWLAKQIEIDACNAHEALVAALERVEQQLTDLHAAIVDRGLQIRSEGETAINNAKAALDAARGE